MTLILPLPDNKEALLKSKTEAEGISAEQYAERSSIVIWTNGLMRRPSLSWSQSLVNSMLCPMKPSTISQAMAPVNTIITSTALQKRIRERRFR